MRARFRKKESRSFFLSICAQLAFNVKITSFWYDLWAGGNSVIESIKGGLFYENGGERMTVKLRKDSQIPAYMAYPRFLLTMDISETAKLADVVPILRQYSDLVGQIKTLSRERKGLLDEKKATSALNVLKQRELAKRIAQLSEDIEELHSEKAMILSRFDKTDDEGMKEVKKWVASMESSLQRLEQTEAKYQAKLDAALAQFRELTGEAESMDKAELHVQRQGLRKTYTQDARDRLQKAHGKQYSPITMMEAQQDVDHLLREDETRAGSASG